MNALVTQPKVPAYVDTRLKGCPPALHGYVWRSSVSQTEIDAFLEKHAFGHDGKTEYVDGRRTDGVIEFGRTVPKIGTQEYRLQEACVFAADLESHFGRIEVTVL